MKIVFMGTPDFAKESLEAIYNAGYEVLAVVTNPDKPKGRGLKMISSPVKCSRKGHKSISTFKSKKQCRIYRRIKKIKTRCIMCCSIWKDFTKGSIGYSKIWSNKCTRITSS